jgi:hypothetical protein
MALAVIKGGKDADRSLLAGGPWRARHGGAYLVRAIVKAATGHLDH